MPGSSPATKVSPAGDIQVIFQFNHNRFPGLRLGCRACWSADGLDPGAHRVPVGKHLHGIPHVQGSIHQGSCVAAVVAVLFWVQTRSQSTLRTQHILDIQSGGALRLYRSKVFKQSQQGRAGVPVGGSRWLDDVISLKRGDRDDSRCTASRVLRRARALRTQSG